MGSVNRQKQASTPRILSQFSDRVEIINGKLLLIFVFYVDTLLSTRVISRFFIHDYHTIADAIDEFEAAFLAGFPAVWSIIAPCVGGSTQVNETPQTCSRYRVRTRHGKVWSGKAQLSRGGVGELEIRAMR